MKYNLDIPAKNHGSYKNVIWICAAHKTRKAIFESSHIIIEGPEEAHMGDIGEQTEKKT